MRKDKSIRDFLMVDRVGQIRMLAHQVRLAILRSLVEAPKTGAEIGRELGREAARIHSPAQPWRRPDREVGRTQALEGRAFTAPSPGTSRDPRVGPGPRHIESPVR
jgi:hypothetical protein